VALAAAVSRILLDPGLATRLRHDIAAAADDGLSWRHTADTLVQLYSRVAGAQRA